MQNLRIIGKKELFELEPHVNPTALGALLSPDAGECVKLLCLCVGIRKEQCDAEQGERISLNYKTFGSIDADCS